jgi:3-hydroxy acid dehydrogenase/malonic semialdehyde reductase
MEKIAMVTGATAGIGKATAFKLAKINFTLILTGRRKNLLDSLKDQLIKTYGVDVMVLNFDVRNREEVNNAIKNLPEEWKNIDVLVNNAGLAVGLDHIQEGDPDDWERMIDTNIKGLLYVSRAIAPLMIKRGKGHIVNIGSIAGKEVYEKGNVYCSTKHAVDAITKGMRIDMLKHGIKVTSVCPGLVETEFSVVRFKGDRKKAKVPYEGITPLTGDDIADAIVFVISRPPHVNINDMIIMPSAQANSSYIHRES